MEIREFGARVAVGTAGMTLAGTALLNAIPGEQSPLGFEYGGRDPKVVTETVPPQTEVGPGMMRTVREPGPALELAVPGRYARNFKAAELPQNVTNTLRTYVASVQAEAGADGTYAIQVLGEASDDDGTRDNHGDGNFGAKSDNNQRLALGREKVVAKSLEPLVDGSQLNAIVALGRSGTITELGGREVILPTDEVATLRDIASRHDLTLNELRAHYNANRSQLHLNSDEQGVLREYIDRHRGVILTSVIERTVAPVIGPCDIVTTERTIPGQQLRREIPGRPGMRFEFLPLPGYLPRRRKGKPVEPKPNADNEVPSVPEAPAGEPVAHETPSAAPVPAQKGDTGPSAGIPPMARTGVSRMAREGARAERTGLDRTERTLKIVLPVGVAALIGVIGLSPIFEHDEKIAGHTLPANNENCQTTVDVTPSERDVYMSSLWHMLYHGLIKHDGTGLKQKYVGRIVDEPGSRTVTTKSYTEYRVDQQGNLIEKIMHPENTYSHPLLNQK